MFCCWFALQNICGQVDCLGVEKLHETGFKNVVGKIIGGVIGIKNGRGELWGVRGWVKAG